MSKQTRGKIVVPNTRKEGTKMAEKEKVGSQMLEFMRTSMDVTMDAITLMQEQNERFLNILLDQNMLTQHEGQKFLQDWISKAKDGREKFKKTLEENWKNVENIFTKG